MNSFTGSTTKIKPELIVVEHVLYCVIFPEIPWLIAIVDNEIDAVHAFNTHIKLNGENHARHIHMQPRTTEKDLLMTEEEYHYYGPPVGKRYGNMSQPVWSSMRDRERELRHYDSSILNDNNLFRLPAEYRETNS